MWQEYGSEWADDGQPGGDVQVGKACSRRFHNPEIPGALVTVYYYPTVPMQDTYTEGDLTNLGVEMQTEFLRCKDIDDPGGTEEWSTYTYEGVDTMPLEGDVEKAERCALSALRKFDPVRDIHWDGTRF